MAEAPIQRRLAAILAADVAGYSRLMGENEERTLTALSAHLDNLILPCVAEHRGRVVKTTGDGLLAEFASVVDAVRCAVAFQEGMRARNDSVAPDEAIRFRIGVNLGDVIVKDDDVFGDGVNVAARLEGLAEPDGIVVSSSVRDQIGNRLDLQFEDLGPRQVKNIGVPVHALAIRTQGQEAAPTQAAGSGAEALPEPVMPSIAVMPFDNLSNDPEQEYFSDGITEDVITELSMISGLFVIARHSTFAYKGKPVTLRQVGRELGVRYILEGSVRKAGNRLRITAQLIDSASEHHLWAERYDRELEDIFAVQEEVARNVAGALAVKLKPQEGERIARPVTDNIEAYDLYLRTRAAPWPPTRENILTARHAYEQIIAIDPGFVGGHAGLALSDAMAVIFGTSPEPAQDAKTALETAKKAIAVNTEFAQAHSALGLALLANGDHDAAVRAAQKAVELAPSDADAHCYHGVTLLAAGDGDGARAAAERALRLDPQFTSGPYLNLLGIANFIAGDYDESIESFERNVARGGPMGPPMLHAWAAACAAAGRMEDARRIGQQLLSFQPEFSIGRYPMIRIYKRPEDKERLVENMRKAGIPD